MKKKLVNLTTMLSIILVLGISFFPVSPAFAATCTGSGCNGVNPYGTTCWNDAYNASVRYASTMYNANKYSPGCIANWSYTRNTSSTYLAAETVGVYTYHGSQPYLYAWNSMWDGSGTVCTRGYMGPTYKNYNVSTSNACA
jgi:hypothetical protein